MRYALTKLPAEAFIRPEYTPSSKAVLNGNWQVPGSDGLVHEILYWVNKNNPTGLQPGDPSQDPQFERWDAPVRAIYGGYGVYAPSPAQQIPIPQVVPPQQYQNPYGGSFVPSYPAR